MTRRHSLPVFLSMLLLGALLAAPRAAAQDIPPSATGEEQAPAAATSPEQTPVAKGGEGKIAVTRSDGSTGFTRAPDKKEIRKLVSYIRDGMRRADRADTTKSARRSMQYRRVIKIRK
jgi:hypothetical protein